MTIIYKYNIIVRNWFKNTFGFARYEGYSKSISISQKEDYLVGGFEAGAEGGVSLTAGDDSKLITFYYEAPNKWWKLWEYKIGVKVNSDKFGLNLSVGTTSSSVGVKINDTSFSLDSDLDFSPNTKGCFLPSIIKNSFKISNEVDYRNLSSKSYISIYVNPLQSATVILLVYYSQGAIVPALFTLLEFA